MADFDRESMQEMFIYEMSQLLVQLEQILLEGESGFSVEEINEIFRIMHTIKGSSAMMLYTNVAETSHSMEDMFFYLREGNPDNESINFSKLTDLMLEGMDFIKVEFSKIENGEELDGDGEPIINKITKFVAEMKGESSTDLPEDTLKLDNQNIESVVKSKLKEGFFKYKVKIFFEDGAEMENVRAFTFVNNLKEIAENVSHVPENILEEISINHIKENGFTVIFDSELSFEEINEKLQQTIYLRNLELEELFEEEESGSKMILNENQNLFHAVLKFDKDSGIENVRAFTLLHNLEGLVDEVKSNPEEPIKEENKETIEKNGFELYIKTTKSYDEVKEILTKTVDLEEIKLEDIKNKNQKQEDDFKNDSLNDSNKNSTKVVQKQISNAKKSQSQALISVNVSRLDQLLNLMGELVIAEAMVSQNPELESLELESFHKEARQLRKIISDVQDTLMTMRMMPLSTTFFRMNRIVRDMCRGLDKEVKLEVIGEETEVDKNIIEHISDPLMHIVRNSVDHGIEKPDIREAKGKRREGTVILEARNSGSDVLIIVKDDGAGLDRETVIRKAKENNLLKKPEQDYTDKEVYQFIFMPGFSTNEAVTGYSGRGVGMDVVFTNLDSVGGTISVESEKDVGSIFTLKIPLTLAIIDGMTFRMGDAKYTIPINAIQQSFKATKEDILKDPSGNEMIRARGECYNLIRLNEFFGIESSTSEIEDGIVIMVENGNRAVCVLVDELMGEQQVVLKTLPKYIKKIRGITGCTLLGNGDISLIIDTAGFFDN